jgi:large subunit ribosomal protein L21
MSAANPYAVIEDRGKQYLVRPGARVRLDLRGEAPGTKVVFDRVLLVSGDDGVRTGTPTVGATVEATVVGEVKGKKLVVFKKKRRKGLRRKRGHRARYTDVVVDRIS